MFHWRYRLCALLLALSLPAAAALASPDQNSFRQNWAEAVSLMRADAPRAAVPLLERLVSAAPQASLVRAELAVAYFRIGDDEKAQYHFNRALGGALDDRQRQAILAHLHAIEQRRNWHATFSFGMVPHSNAARRSTQNSYMIGGDELILDQQAAPGTGVDFSGRLIWVSRPFGNARGVLSMTGFGSHYREAAWNDYTLRAEAGLSFVLDRGTQYGFGFLASQRWLAGGRYSLEQGVYATWGARLGARTRATLRSELTQVRVSSLPGRNANVLRLNASVTRAQSARLELRTRGFLTLTSAAAPHESSRQIGGSIGGSYTFDRGWQAGIDLTLSNLLHRAAHPVFGTARNETETRAQFQLSNRNIQFAGYAPVLELGHERRRASISLYEYRNTYAALRWTRQF